jgi:acetyl esterase/lipase
MSATNASAQKTPAKTKTSTVAKTSSWKFPPVPEGVTIVRDVSYLPPHRSEKLDLYLPANRPPNIKSPAVVIIHGGGWAGGDKSSSREFNIGTTLAKEGYVCASVEYLKEEHGRWPTNLFDCKNAVRFLRAHAAKYGVGERIGVIGGSAGGHLALMVAYTHGVKELTPPDDVYPGISDKVHACVNLYGITDLLTRQSTDPEGKPNGELRPASLIKVPRETGTEEWRKASPVYYVNRSTPPTLTAHGMADTTVDRDQAVQLDRALAKAGVQHELIMIEGIGHTFDLDSWKRQPLPQDVRGSVIRFFDKHLR